MYEKKTFFEDLSRPAAALSADADLHAKGWATGSGVGGGSATGGWAGIYQNNGTNMNSSSGANNAAANKKKKQKGGTKVLDKSHISNKFMVSS